MQLFLSKCWETNLTKGGDQTLETPGSLPCRATSRKLWAAGLQVQVQLQKRFCHTLQFYEVSLPLQEDEVMNNLSDFQRWMLDAELRCYLVIAVGTSLCDTPSTAEALLFRGDGFVSPCQR